MQSSFKELDHLVIFITLILAISKIMIFVDNIDTTKQITIYSQYQFFARLSKKTTLFMQVFSANLTVKSQI